MTHFTYHEHLSDALFTLLITEGAQVLHLGCDQVKNEECDVQSISSYTLASCNLLFFVYKGGSA